MFCKLNKEPYFFDALDVEYVGELTFRKIDAKGAIKQHPTALREAFEAGRRLLPVKT